LTKQTHVVHFQILIAALPIGKLRFQIDEAVEARLNQTDLKTGDPDIKVYMNRLYISDEKMAKWCVETNEKKDIMCTGLCRW
jgi:hypothetical protein